MSNSKRVEAGVEGKPCVMCGGTEYDIRKITAVADGQDSDAIGDLYQRCLQCKSMYDYDESDSAGVADRD